MAATCRERETYTRDYKLEAVRLANEGFRTIVEVAASLGLSAEHLYRWRQGIRSGRRDGVSG